MNLSMLSAQLSKMPDQALMQEMQRPSGSVPQFLVLSELQRRQSTRKASSGPPPTSTVAQDLSGAAQPRPMPPNTMGGIAGVPPQGMAGAAMMARQQQQQLPPGMAKGGKIPKINFRPGPRLDYHSGFNDKRGPIGYYAGGGSIEMDPNWYTGQYPAPAWYGEGQRGQNLTEWAQPFIDEVTGPQAHGPLYPAKQWLRDNVGLSPDVRAMRDGPAPQRPMPQLQAPSYQAGPDTPSIWQGKTQFQDTPLAHGLNSLGRGASSAFMGMSSSPYAVDPDTGELMAQAGRAPAPPTKSGKPKGWDSMPASPYSIPSRPGADTSFAVPDAPTAGTPNRGKDIKDGSGIARIAVNSTTKIKGAAKGSLNPHNPINTGEAATVDNQPSFKAPTDDEYLATIDKVLKSNVFPDEMGGIRDRLAKTQAMADKQNASAPWLSMAKAGFNMASGTSPFFATNAGNALSGMTDDLRQNQITQLKEQLEMDGMASKVAEAEATRRVTAANIATKFVDARQRAGELAYNAQLSHEDRVSRDASTAAYREGIFAQRDEARDARLAGQQDTQTAHYYSSLTSQIDTESRLADAWEAKHQFDAPDQRQENPHLSRIAAIQQQMTQFASRMPGHGQAPAAAQPRQMPPPPPGFHIMGR